MRNTKTGFTLVELIVVITILAILGTIAFISLQGYSADARNTKRTSDIKNIESSMVTASAKETPLLSFVDNTNTGSELATPSIGGSPSTSTGTSTNYRAGIPNYTALSIKQEDFKDPSGNEDYIIGVTTKVEGKYEVVASMENSSGNRSAKIVGTYSPRTDTDAVTLSTAISSNKAILSDEDINKFKKGDTVTDGSSNTNGSSNIRTVDYISSNGKTITLKGTGVTFTGVTLKLASPEVLGLIKGADTGTGAGRNPVTNGDTSNLPY